MTHSPTNSRAATHIPGLGCACAALFAPTRRRGASYFEAIPFLIAVTAVLVFVSGLVLSAWYDPRNAARSVEFIGRSVREGWLVRAYHETGTSLLAGLTYLYLFNALLTRSYRAKGDYAWLLAVKLLAVILAASWFGYVLSGGAGGFWSYQNAYNAALQLRGFPGAVALWILSGGLPKLLLMHLLLGLSLALALWVFIAARHKARLAPEAGQGVGFYPTYAAQYIVALAVLGIVGALLIGFFPHLGQPAANALPGDGLSFSPNPGLPWYLAPIGAVAGIFHATWGGILVVVALAVTLYAVPWLDLSDPAFPPSRRYKALTWGLGLVVLALGADATIPGCPIAPVLDVVFTLYVFIHFLILTPFITSGEVE